MVVGKKGWLVAVLVASFVGVALLPAREAGAIPPFARKYKTSCNTCHIAFPRLTAFGEAFKRNGFQIPLEGDEAYVKDEPVSLGASAYKRAWPDAVWPGEIPGMPPIGFHITQQFKRNSTADRRANGSSSSFNFPEAVEMLLGGTLGEDIAFFTELAFEVKDGETVTDIEDSWLMFLDPLQKIGDSEFLAEGALNVKIGKLTPDIVPYAALYRLTATDLMVYRYRVNSGARRVRQHTPGIEFNGILDHRFKYAVGLTEGDSGNSNKDFYARVAYKFGGMGFDGSTADAKGGEGAGPLAQQASEFWVDDSVTLGSFVYIGEDSVGRPAGGGLHGSQNQFRRYGVDARWKCDRLDLHGALIVGEDDDPFQPDIGSVDTTAYYIEGDYILYPWLIAALRFENLSFSKSDSKIDTFGDRRRVVPALIFQVRSNVIVRVEGNFSNDSVNSTTKGTNTDQLIVTAEISF